MPQKDGSWCWCGEDYEIIRKFTATFSSGSNYIISYTKLVPISQNLKNRYNRQLQNKHTKKKAINAHNSGNLPFQC